MITWNIDGLKGKGEDPTFISHIQEYDIIALLETWCSTKVDVEQLEVALPDYESTVKYGTKQGKRGRPSGGIVVLVRKNTAKYLTPVGLDFKFGVSFKISSALIEKQCIIIFTYLPPHGSSAYTLDEQNGVLILEKYITELEVNYPDARILISGDLNARTKDLPDYIINDSAEYLPLPCTYTEDLYRQSSQQI
jgi:exonuclease III